MRVRDITVHDVPPVNLFSVSDLGDVVVVAGPNGIGKTRLMEHLVNHLRQASPNPNVEGQIEATAPNEREAWGKSSLDLASPEDMELFRVTLQQSRRRQKWKSSLINFESDRTIQNLQPLQPSWDMPDPEAEEVSWDSTSGYMRDRFQDTVHWMYRMIEAQRQGYGKRAVELGRQGHTSMNLNFSDPMTPFREIFSLLLAPKELVDPSVRHQQLEFRLEGAVFPFQSLSSGEREVVNIAFDFLLRAPEDCIVFFDEPELHLHPELSYRLIQSLQRIGLRNQFILSTHSPDVITSALDQSVVFVSPPRVEPGGGPANQAIPVSESDKTNKALRLMGQSIGIIALGKRIVLIEGEDSSLDKRTYGSIIGNRWPGLALVPSGGKHVIESFAAIYEAVLSQSIWGVEFFMLCDRDSEPAVSPEQGLAAASGRLRALPRRHLENFFLDEEVWAKAFAHMEESESWLRSPEQIRAKLRELSEGLISYATALSVSHDLRQLVGNIDVMPDGCHNKSVTELQALLVGRATSEASRIGDALDTDFVTVRTEERFNELADSIHNDTLGWIETIPGKSLLRMFTSAANLNLSRAVNLYLIAARDHTPSPFADILAIFEGFAEEGA